MQTEARFVDEIARVEKARAKSLRAVMRAARRARSGGTSLIVLGALSALLGVGDPLSAGFLLSFAVVANGFLQRRFAVALEARDPKSIVRLAINQAALGTEVMVFSVWQARSMTPQFIRDLLFEPTFSTIVDLLTEEDLARLTLQLPEMLRIGYLAVAMVAVAGCSLAAFYYLSRRKHLERLAAVE